MAVATFATVAFSAVDSAGAQPPPGAFNTPFTTFRGYSPGLKMHVSLVEERVGFGAHARVSCADGSEHWQLLVEGGLGGKVDAGGRFRHTEYDPATAGQVLPSTIQVTMRDIEESVVHGTPASFRQIKGRVLSNSVVGWIRSWEGPDRAPGSLDSKCGTGSPAGKWVRFAVPRVNGPAQPHGHWPPRRSVPVDDLWRRTKQAERPWNGASRIRARNIEHARS